LSTRPTLALLFSCNSQVVDFKASEEEEEEEEEEEDIIKGMGGEGGGATSKLRKAARKVVVAAAYACGSFSRSKALGGLYTTSTTQTVSKASPSPLLPFLTFCQNI
jgi:hypothetical protein